MPVLRELTDKATIPPDIQNLVSHGLRSPGARMSMEHPSVWRTCRTVPICAVGLPPSRPTMNRSPTPATPASSSCRKCCSLRALRTKVPISAGVLTLFAIIAFPLRKMSAPCRGQFSRSVKLLMLDVVWLDVVWRDKFPDRVTLGYILTAAGVFRNRCSRDGGWN